MLEHPVVPKLLAWLRRSKPFDAITDVHCFRVLNPLKNTNDVRGRELYIFEHKRFGQIHGERLRNVELLKETGSEQEIRGGQNGEDDGGFLGRHCFGEKSWLVG